MPTSHDDSSHIFLPEARKRLGRYAKVIQFTHSSTWAAGVMLLAAIASVVIANTGAYGPFSEFFETEVGVYFGNNEAGLTIAEVISDIFMAIFFLLVGLEVKYELTVGELTNIRKAILPIMGAVGGVLMPIVIYLIINASSPDSIHGWGVPTATDIAFALGILALLGDRVPSGVRVFLSTLAVADDIIAILIIAIFYGQTPDVFWLLAAAVVMVALIVLNRMHVYMLSPYILLGIVLWYCVFSSGIHSTIAGVLLAFTIPYGSHVNLRNFARWSLSRVHQANIQYNPDEPVITQDEYIQTVQSIGHVVRQVTPPATRLEHRLYPWVYFGILPLFALTNADVSFTDIDMSLLFSDPILYGVFFGLLLGKPIGIMLMSFIMVKTKLASLPEGVNWLHMLGAAILGGVGFTMAIFVANLAFVDPEQLAAAKFGILSASLVAGIVGFVFLTVQAAATQRRELANAEKAEEEVIDEESSEEATCDAEDRIDNVNEKEETIDSVEEEETSKQDSSAYRASLRGYDPDKSKRKSK